MYTLTITYLLHLHTNIRSHRNHNKEGVEEVPVLYEEFSTGEYTRITSNIKNSKLKTQNSPI